MEKDNCPESIMLYEEEDSAPAQQAASEIASKLASEITPDDIPYVMNIFDEEVRKSAQESQERIEKAEAQGPASPGKAKTSNIEKAISLAVEGHKGQEDKAGAPYILHPLRIMFKMASEEKMIAAVLHDLIEDTETSLDDLREYGFDTGILEAIDSVRGTKHVASTKEYRMVGLVR